MYSSCLVSAPAPRVWPLCRGDDLPGTCPLEGWAASCGYVGAGQTARRTTSLQASTSRPPGLGLPGGQTTQSLMWYFRAGYEAEVVLEGQGRPELRRLS